MAGLACAEDGPVGKSGWGSGEKPVGFAGSANHVRVLRLCIFEEGRETGAEECDA